MTPSRVVHVLDSEKKIECDTGQQLVSLGKVSSLEVIQYGQQDNYQIRVYGA